jgi:thiamine phosphate synthase YjbQ (UPF0047 family)
MGAMLVLVRKVTRGQQPVENVTTSTSAKLELTIVTNTLRVKILPEVTLALAIKDTKAKVKLELARTLTNAKPESTTVTNTPHAKTQTEVSNATATSGGGATEPSAPTSMNARKEAIVVIRMLTALT